MQRMSLNTAIMSFAFTGVLAPHHHRDETRGVSPQRCGRSTEWERSAGCANQRAVILETSIQAAAERQTNPGSVWVGALTQKDCS